MFRNCHTLKNKKIWNCTSCGYSTKRKSDISRHLSVHSDVRVFQCDKCSKSFKSGGGLKQHSSCVYSNLKPFWCDTCRKSFRTRRDLERHYISHGDGVERETFYCTNCNKHFYYPSLLVRHLASLSHKIKFKGPQCQFCPTSEELKEHVKSHLEDF